MRNHTLTRLFGIFGSSVIFLSFKKNPICKNIYLLHGYWHTLNLWDFVYVNEREKKQTKNPSCPKVKYAWYSYLGILMFTRPACIFS